AGFQETGDKPHDKADEDGSDDAHGQSPSSPKESFHPSSDLKRTGQFGGGGLRPRFSVPLDQRLDGGDLPVQRGTIRAAQGSVADLAPGFERLAVVVQVAVLDGDDLFYRR